MTDDLTEGDAEGEPWGGEGEPTPNPVDPGEPAAENVVFVVLGVLVALFALARIAGLV